MKILHLGIKGIPSKGGADRVVEGIVREMRDRHEITVLCNSRYIDKYESMPGVRLVRIPTPPGKHLQPVVYLMLSALYALFRGTFDVIHVHNIEASFVLPLLRCRFRVISTSHGTPHERDKWSRIAKFLLRQTEYPFVYLSNIRTSVSLPLAKQYEKRFGKAVNYIPNGVEVDLSIDHAAAKDTLAAHGAPDKGYILFAAGRVDPTKGCHLLLKALPNLPKDVHIVIVGNTYHARGYDAHLRSLADERVVFIPFVSSKSELFGIIERCRLFVFPSTIEAMSMMLLEVASLEIPLLWSDIPENQVVMPPESLSFRSDNVKDLSDKLLWALNNPDRMHKIAEQVLLSTRGKFSWREIAGRYKDFYVQLEDGNSHKLES